MFEKIKSDLAIVFDRDPAARSYLEILTAYPGVHAVMIHRLSHKIWNLKLYWLARLLAHIARIFTSPATDLPWVRKTQPPPRYA